MHTRSSGRRSDSNRSDPESTSGSSSNTSSQVDSAEVGTSRAACEMEKNEKTISFDTKEFCFFCYKKCLESPEIDNDDSCNAKLATANEHEEISSRFMQLISRYLELTYLPLKQRGNRVNCLSCDACSVHLKNICKQFQELEKIKLQLDWGISNLICVMKCADNTKSRLMTFHEAVVEAEDGMSPDEQALMNAFRRNVVTQSFRKTFPRVLVKQMHREDPFPYEAASCEFNKDQGCTNVDASELQQGKEIHIRLPTSAATGSSRSTLPEFPVISALATSTPQLAYSRGTKRNLTSEDIPLAKVSKSSTIEDDQTIQLIDFLNCQDISSDVLTAVDNNSICENGDARNEERVITINDENVSQRDKSDCPAESSLNFDSTGSPPHFDETLNTNYMYDTEYGFPPPGQVVDDGLPVNLQLQAESHHQFVSESETYESSFGTAHIPGTTTNAIFQEPDLQQPDITFENQNPDYLDQEFNGIRDSFTDDFILLTPPESDNSNDNFAADVQPPSFNENAHAQHNLADLPEPFQMLFQNEPTSYVFAAMDSLRWEERNPITHIPLNFVGCLCCLNMGNNHYVDDCPWHGNVGNGESYQNESTANFNDYFQNHETQNGEDLNDDGMDLATDACYTNEPDSNDNFNRYGYDSDDDTAAVYHSLKIEQVEQE